jgi:hypothetical protein
MNALPALKEALHEVSRRYKAPQLLNFSARNQNSLRKFLNEKKIEPSDYKSFIIYQLENRNAAKKRIGVVPIPIIFGPKAIFLWKEATKPKEKKLALSQEDIFLIDERERKRFFGTPESLLHCLLSASYDEKSQFCPICENKELCAMRK